MPDLSPLARDLKVPRFVHQFTVSVPREVEEETTRVEGDKTITEKVKVNRAVNIEFGMKKLSRAEREDADIYRSVWETKYVDAGILPQAILLKKYANYGGILSDEQKAEYNGYQRDFLLAETALKRLQVTDPSNKEAIEAAALQLVTLRQAMIDFQQEQASFFSNTAETKARQKLIEWLVLHLTYYRPANAAGEPGEWTQFFTGLTTEAKLDALDAAIERQDDVWLKAQDTIMLLATVYASGDEKSLADVMELAKQEETSVNAPKA